MRRAGGALLLPPLGSGRREPRALRGSSPSAASPGPASSPGSSARCRPTSGSGASSRSSTRTGPSALDLQLVGAAARPSFRRSPRCRRTRPSRRRAAQRGAAGGHDRRAVPVRSREPLPPTRRPKRRRKETHERRPDRKPTRRRRPARKPPARSGPGQCRRRCAVKPIPGRRLVLLAPFSSPAATSRSSWPTAPDSQPRRAALEARRDDAPQERRGRARPRPRSVEGRRSGSAGSRPRSTSSTAAGSAPSGNAGSRRGRDPRDPQGGGRRGARRSRYSTLASQKLPLAQMQILFTVRCDYSRFKQLLRPSRPATTGSRCARWHQPGPRAPGSGPGADRPRHLLHARGRAASPRRARARRPRRRRGERDRWRLSRPKLGSRRQAILLAALAVVLLLAVVRWRPGSAKTAPGGAASARPAAGRPPGATVRRGRPAMRSGGPRGGAAARRGKSIPTTCPCSRSSDFAPHARQGRAPIRGATCSSSASRRIRRCRRPRPAPPAAGRRALRRSHCRRLRRPPRPSRPRSTSSSSERSVRRSIRSPSCSRATRSWNVRDGGQLFGKFVLRKVGYESIDVGFVGFPESETRRVGITP